MEYVGNISGFDLKLNKNNQMYVLELINTFQKRYNSIFFL